MKKTLTIALSLALCACTPAKTSPQQHARHYIFATSHDSDPQFRMLVADSIKNAVPMFDYFYQLGKEDKQAGKDRATADQRIAYFHSDEFLTKAGRTSQFINHTYQEGRDKRNEQIFVQEITGAYWDGYEGR